MRQTRQTDSPIEHYNMQPSNRFADGLVKLINKGQMEMDPPYQRGSVWTDDQRIDLMRSFLSGYPTGAVIFNERQRSCFTDINPDWKIWVAVIDGKQRLLACAAWFAGDLAIPASWIGAEFVATPYDTLDGPYVTVNDLTEIGRRKVEMRMSLAVVMAQVDTVEEEALVFEMVNSGGTPQTEATIAEARRIAATGGHER